MPNAEYDRRNRNPVPAVWETPVRTAATFLAALLLCITASAVRPQVAAAQETIVMEGDAGGAMPTEPGACGCRDRQAPPWHGNVAGDACGPSCPPPTMFHADPCRQLWMKHQARMQGYALPPCFPRMHGRLTEGWWPTPRPIALPRCPNCGAHIEAGM